MPVVTHHYSNGQVNATGTLTVWNGATTASVAATDVVRPQDWNSAHDQLFTLSGNTITSASSTAAGSNVIFQGAGGVSLGGSSDTLFISAIPRVTDLWYPPVNRQMSLQQMISGTSGATGGSTQHTGTIYMQPIVLPNGLIYNGIDMVISGAATSAGTGSASAGYMLGLYSDNAGTLSLITSYQFCHVMSQNSISARTHSWWYGTNSTSNTTTLSGNVSASFNQQMQIKLTRSAAMTLSAGTYYQGVIHTNRTSGLNCGGMSSAMCLWESNSGGFSYLGETVWNHLIDTKYGGQISTTFNAPNSGLLSMPSSIHSSAVSNNSTGASQKFPFARYF